MQAFGRLYDLIRSNTWILRTRSFLDASEFNRAYGVAMDQYLVRLDAQFALLIETVWAAGDKSYCAGGGQNASKGWL